MSKERVILIRGDETKWYEQAIFIMKKNSPENKVPMDFVKEAERIMNGYLHSENKDNKTVLVKRKNYFDLLINVMMLVSCLVLAGFLISAMI